MAVGGALSRNLSIFLDLLRLMAALLVLMGHAGEVYRMHLPTLLGHSAKEGVAIFFVLSGLVIAFVTDRKERDWRAFARARALRMYSVIPLAILVLWACYLAGTAMNPDAYGLGQGLANAGSVGQPPTGWSTLRLLTFTNELWFDRAMVSTGTPFWSLGFEVAYYVIFAIFAYARGGWKWAMAIAWMLIVGPRIILALPLWLIGVGTWRLLQRGFRMSALSGGASMGAIALAALIWRREVALMAVPLFEWGDAGVLAASMGYYIVLCLLLAAAIIVFAASTPEASIWPSRLTWLVRYAAGASFTLYIAHLPIMVLVAALWPASCASLGAGLVATTISFATTFILAELGERRKSIYSRFFQNAQ